MYLEKINGPEDVKKIKIDELLGGAHYMYAQCRSSD